MSDVRTSLRYLSIGVLFLVAVCAGAAGGPPPLEVYGALPDTESVALSPDGTMLAIVGTQQAKRFLAIKKVGGGLIGGARIDDSKLADIDWVGNDYVVFYRHRTVKLYVGGSSSELIEAVVVNAKTGAVKPLLRDSPDYLNAIFGSFGYVREDGRWYGYYGIVPKRNSGTSDFIERGYPDLYRVDIEASRVQRVANGSSLPRDWVVDDEGQIVVESSYDPNTGNWRIFPPQSGEKTLIGGHSPFSFGLEGLGRVPGSVLVRNATEEGGVAELHADTGKIEAFLPAGKAFDLIRSPMTRLVIGAVLVDENRTLMFDPVLERRYQTIDKAFHDHVISVTSISEDLNRFIVHAIGKDSAGVWQLVDFKTGKAEPVAEDHPDIPDAMIGSAEMFDYRAADGLPLQGVLTLPPGMEARNLPLVVLPHGGPEARDRVDFDWWAQAFASRGYAVFQPNFRGSSGYGEAFRNAGYGEWGRKMQTDISDGVAALAAKGIVDPKRACIVGASYGGYAALAGVTLQHGLYRCAASYGGVTNLRRLLHSIQDQSRGELYRYADPSMRHTLSYLGFTASDDDGLRALSPELQAEKADAPVLLIYGEDDTVVPPEQSRYMATALKSAGKPVDLVVLKGEDHWLSRSETRLQMLKAMVEFVEKHNPPNAMSAAR